MRTQIDIDKSVRRRRLTFKMTTEFFFARCLDNLIWLIFISGCILFLSDKKNYLSDKNRAFVLFVLLVVAWLTIGLVYINKMIIAGGINMESNRKKIIQLLRERFPGSQLDDSGQTLIRYNLKSFGWRKQIIVIFNEKMIFLNYTTYGRFNIKSPFHSIFNYWMLKNFAKQFEKT